MCNHYTCFGSSKGTFRGASTADGESFPEGMQLAFDRPGMPIILNTNPTLIVQGIWGLIPSWVSNIDEYKAHTFNARIEELTQKPSYKDYIGNRCLVIMNHYFEWQEREIVDKGKRKKKKFQYKLQMQGGEDFAVAGIYNIYKGHPTFTMVTTHAVGIAAEIHNTKLRMPVILSEVEEMDWLLGKPTQMFHDSRHIPLIAEPQFEEPEQPESEPDLFS